MYNEIFLMFRNQETIPFAILAFLVAGLVVIIERFSILQFVYRINFQQFNSNLRRMLAAGDLERARAFCLATSKTGVPLIITKSIDAYQSDAFKVRMVATEEILAFLPRVRQRIGQLPNLATAILLLGALGSVQKIWEAFNATDVVEIGLKSTFFAYGLSHAMAPLAFSLFCAVFLMIPYGFLDAMATRLENDMEHSLTIALNILAPETQTIIAAQPIVGHSGVASEESHANTANDEGASGQSLAHEPSVNKGARNDLSFEKVEAIPDEEEII